MAVHLYPTHKINRCDYQVVVSSYLVGWWIGHIIAISDSKIQIFKFFPTQAIGYRKIHENVGLHVGL